ncbi:MAG: DUF2442 domain-containing protein [Betaproteobacteria bacterium]|nr:MAG: DUF2442 domain-containing protein [Betaproteobacteria bacterium]
MSTISTRIPSEKDVSILPTLVEPNPQLSGARHVGDYQMWLRFADGREGIVDFSDDLWGEDLKPLQDPSTFAELKFDDAIATLSWERGGIDISPAYLYSKLESVQ